MKAAVQLHQFANMRLAVPPLAIGFPLPLPAPGPGFAQPTPQTLGSNPQPVLAGQVLARQRRTEIRIALLRPTEHRSTKLRRISAIRSPPAVPVLQRLGPAPAIPRPHPLRLPITNSSNSAASPSRKLPAFTRPITSA